MRADMQLTMRCCMWLGNGCRQHLHNFQAHESILRKVLYDRVRQRAIHARRVCLKSARKLCDLPNRVATVSVLSCVSKHLLEPENRVKVDTRCIKFLHDSLSAHVRAFSKEKTATTWLQEMLNTKSDVEASKEPSDEDTAGFDRYDKIKMPEEPSTSLGFTDKELDEMVEHTMVKHTIEERIDELEAKSNQKARLQRHHENYVSNRTSETDAGEPQKMAQSDFSAPTPHMGKGIPSTEESNKVTPRPQEKRIGKIKPKTALFYGISAVSLLCLVGSCGFACWGRNSEESHRHKYPLRHAANLDLGLA